MLRQVILISCALKFDRRCLHLVARHRTRLPARLFQPSRSVHLRRGSCGCPVRISLVEPRGVTPRPRNFDTEPPSPYCYELQPDRRWESVANVHTAAGLRVRLWLSIRPEVKTVGAANEPSDSMPYFARNGCRRELYANGIGFASAK